MTYLTDHLFIYTHRGQSITIYKHLDPNIHTHSYNQSHPSLLEYNNKLSTNSSTLIYRHQTYKSNKPV